MKRKVLDYLYDMLFFLIGGMLYSVAIVCIIVPNGINSGGVSGISVILNHLFGVPIGTMTFLLNIPLLIAGFYSFGLKFIIKTAIAIAVSSTLLDITLAFAKPIFLEPLLCCVFGGIMLGAGIGIIFLRGATTGGSDIAAKLINKRWGHISVGRSILILDVFVIILTVIVYKNIEIGLYSVIALYVSSRVADMLLYGADSGKIILAISKKNKEISKGIMNELGRGVTFIESLGAYTGKPQKMLMCAVRKSEVGVVHKLIERIDRTAFIIVFDAGEIIGEGFKGMQ